MNDWPSLFLIKALFQGSYKLAQHENVLALLLAFKMSYLSLICSEPD